MKGLRTRKGISCRRGVKKTAETGAAKIRTGVLKGSKMGQNGLHKGLLGDTHRQGKYLRVFAITKWPGGPKTAFPGRETVRAKTWNRGYSRAKVACTAMAMSETPGETLVG